MKRMKKQDGGHKKIIILISFLFVCFFNNSILGFEIKDYETEIFLNQIIKDIKSVNLFKKKIDYSIYKSEKINAFVNENGKIFISSALIENSDDYVSLLSVIAHEIGHLEKNHLSLRKESINKIKNYNNLGRIGIIAGSLLSGNEEMINTLIANEIATKNIYSLFTQEQEIEADMYAIETLNKLKLPSKSTYLLLEKIEKQSANISVENYEQNFISHPLFTERKDIINFNTDNYDQINLDLNIQFLFIRAKFIGHNNNLELLSKLNEPYRAYAESIIYAKKGNINESLLRINNLIKTNRKNFHFYEAKGDILLSFGYINEATEFYNKNFSKYPNNQYVQLRIFNNLEFEQYNKEKLNNIFKSNVNLIHRYFNNRYILLKYQRLSKILNKTEWIDFLNYWIYIDKNKINLNNYQNTKDKDLKKLIKILESFYL